MKNRIVCFAFSLILSFCGGQLVLANERPIAQWVENDPRVSIYDDTQGVGMRLVEYASIAAEEIQVDDPIHLLLLNGGFVPNPGIVVEKERVLVPVRIVSEILGAKVDWNGVDRIVTITDSSIEILLSIDASEARVNGDAKMLDSPAVIRNDLTYVPLRFIAEALGASVQYVPKFNYGTDGSTEGTQFLLRDKVSVVVIEKTTAIENELTPEECLTVVQQKSAETYENLLVSLEEIGNVFSETQPDYDSQSVYYTNFDLGRYYVYRLEGFELFPILVNKYTGEIYSEHAALPFVNIDEGFINLSWLYQ